MKNIFLFAILIVITVLVFNGCSKKGAGAIVGNWKADPTAEMQQMGMNFDVIYEFTSDKMKMNVTMNGQAQPAMEFNYIVKSDDGTTVVLEVLHPESKEKGDFKLSVQDKKMTMTDPDGKTTTLTKQ